MLITPIILHDCWVKSSRLCMHVLPVDFGIEIKNGLFRGILLQCVQLYLYKRYAQSQNVKFTCQGSQHYVQELRQRQNKCSPFVLLMIQFYPSHNVHCMINLHKNSLKGRSYAITNTYDSSIAIVHVLLFQSSSHTARIMH